MPLTILVPLIAFALPLVIGLVWWTSRSRKLDPVSEETTRQRFASDYPRFTAKQVILSDDLTVAFLLADHQDGVGLLYPVGNHHLTRLLKPEDIKSVAEVENSIDVYVNDFTLGHISVPVADAQSRQMLLSGLAGERN